MMDAALSNKYDRLRDTLRGMGSAAVAFSGGVDSTLLARVAFDELGPRALAITVRAEMTARREIGEAIALAREIGIEHVLLDARALDDPAVADNSPQRCYHCKRLLFGEILDCARSRGISIVVDGSNADDRGDYRPGRRALAEMGVRSPLEECGFTKADVRALSAQLGLPTHAKPAYACLATRVATGTPLTESTLRRIEAAEDALHAAGFLHVRVRDHGDIARIEADPERIAELARPQMREKIAAELQAAGYRYVALDMLGYRTGSMNAAEV